MLSNEDVRKILDKFEIGFKHPFGPHGNESPEHILKRKIDEVNNKKNKGFTLWSFQARDKEGTLKYWKNELDKYNGKTVRVFCKTCKGAKDAKSKKLLCTHYSEDFGNTWEKIPENIRIPHPKRTNFACAFKVKKILEAKEKNKVHKLGLRWLRVRDSKIEKAGSWSRKAYGRGEVLISPDKKAKPKNLPISAVLELESPYIVMLKFEK